MEKPVQDLHNHTVFSDGENTIREMIENAVKHGIDELGISDHYYFQGIFDSSGGRLFKEYIDQLKILKKEYATRISLKLGLELSVLPYPDALKNMPCDFIEILDYILLENLELLPEHVPLEPLNNYLSKIPCRVGLAHSDLYKLASLHKNRGGLQYVMGFLRRNKIFYEINCSSSRLNFDTIIYEPENPMVRKLFSALHENDIKISIGSDTHSLKYFEYERLIKANLLIDVEDLVTM